MKSRFCFAPDEILAETTLSAREKFLFCVINMAIVEGEPSFDLSNKEIAETIGCTSRTACYVVNSLIRKGYLRCERVGIKRFLKPYKVYNPYQNERH